MRPLALLALALPLCVFSLAAHAQFMQPNDALFYVGDGIGSTAENSMGVVNDPAGILLAAIESIAKLVEVVALLVLAVTGIFLAFAQEENQYATAKKTLLITIASLGLIRLAFAIGGAFNTGFVNLDGGGGASRLSTEINGIILFFESIVALIAVFMIVVSGIRAIATFGEDQGLTNIKKNALSIVFGIILIVFRGGFVLSFGTVGGNSPVALINTMRDVAVIGTSYVALFGVAMMIVAGLTMVINKGDEEAKTKAKNLIIKIGIGLTMIIVSGGLINAILSVI